jgi:sec-independent protein translocase protein TatC
MSLTNTTELAPITTPPEENGHAPHDREMTMLEHLEELRQRLTIMALALVAGVVICWIPIPGLVDSSASAAELQEGPGWNSITRFIVSKLIDVATAHGATIISLKPGETFFTFLHVSLIVGAALAMPVIVYELLAFVTPALYDNERRYLLVAVPGVSLSFLTGVLFCYLLMLPFAIRFLAGFGSDLVAPTWSAAYYLEFVTSFLFWVGLTFELPIVMYFLSKLGVVSVQRMTSFRKYAFVLAFIIGAIITPTPDPINQTVISLPIYLLFELGIILARFA